ncbi:DsbA family protein [Oscillospiraceae bacterium MB08-C2-2]|nr:DsbA family protein [Oscillospiraceae bacterium MB08-C2-2]
MRKLEVFFDYACPFCLRGHQYLSELIAAFSNIEILWCPCEAHPRPDSYGPHSDLCIQGMFFALEQGVDIWEYHKRMYSAALQEKLDIENTDVLAGCVKGLLNQDAFRSALKSGIYQTALNSSNDHAYRQSGVWAVPSYRMEGLRLDSVENVGVTKKQLENFMRLADK